MAFIVFSGRSPGVCFTLHEVPFPCAYLPLKQPDLFSFPYGSCQMTATSPKRSWRDTAGLVRADLHCASV